MFKESKLPKKGPPPKPIVLKKCGAEQDDEDCPKGPKLPWSNNLLDMYLFMLQENEWNEKRNGEYEERMKDEIRKLMSQLYGIDNMDDM